MVVICHNRTRKGRGGCGRGAERNGKGARRRGGGAEVLKGKGVEAFKGREKSEVRLLCVPGG